ncbi:DNA topoisomerase I [Candidatus Wolfebacteria bacterium GWA1_42_9]|uniref:DNA topoisomerase 1 n=1 Tax=Candidatus Wolfebacteria bacterium GWA1_42_9 TaxID=1802553 RepID=A0A1F8DMG0_9BACT|nr:MAG: topoisomerase protein [Parcubacteria group bacterium GW2011_GWB1_43_8b]OGM89622.1 MAG: DNA topoisomerase I [Candidatus Wolfebacteria bacterium GWA1_42_9]
MKLIIVESPTKAKTIESFLKGGFKVVSSYGHVRDLPKSKLGIDVEKNFEPHYIVPVKSKKRVGELKKSAQKADQIILATDEDREGEAIAFHLTQVLTPEKKKISKSSPSKTPPRSAEKQESQISRFERIVFHEITPEAIERAIQNPREIDLNLVNAQQARRILDRLVGYGLSPFLWKKVAKRLSAGRVQSVALRLVVEREREIKNFKPEEYWLIDVVFNTEKNKKLETSLIKIDEETIGVGSIKNKKESDKTVDDLKKADFKILRITKKEIRRNSFPPFTTSTLQQTAFARLRFSSKQTMRIAQSLYEKGLITYMRTDSVNLSQQSLVGAQQWLKSNLGEKYALPSYRRFKNKSKNAQEAHEAIRPTLPDFSPKNLGGQARPEHQKLENAQEEKLYELIWRRFIASQMPPAIFDSTAVDINGKGKKEYLLRASGTVLKFDGFLKIWPSKFEEKEIPPIKESEKITLEEVIPSQHFTEPPARYNDASLIKKLEELGIGRPSTYSPIISVIQERNYVIRNEQKRFEPTEIGEKVNDVLVEHFPKVVDVQFTAQMEEELDEIAQGKLKWQKVIGEFYVPFEKNLKEKYKTVEHQAPMTETTDEKCEKCGKPMVFRYSRFGKFLGCSGFPECRNIKPLTDQNAHKNSSQKSFGKCPKCGQGEIVRRRTKKGRFFYGCSKYPDCDYASWTKPIATDNS